MDEKQFEQFDINKLLAILSRQKWLIVACVIGILVPIFILNQIYTPIYKAHTTIVFEEQYGPTSLINPFRSTLTKSFIINQIEEIKSLSLAEEVVKALPAEIINTFPLPKKPTSDFNKDDYIAREIQKRISASAVSNSEVIKIEVKAYSPTAAQVIANMVAEVFQQRNLEVKREETSNVREIIEQQLIAFKSQLDSAEIALKNFKEESKVTVIDREAEEIFKRITEAEIIYNQTKANLDAAKKRLAYIREILKKEREDLVPSITQITSPFAKKLKEQLVDLEVQYMTLKLQNYSDDHPKMVELNEHIEQTKNNLKLESLKIASGENIVDPISQIQKYMEESITLEIEIQTYLAQEKTLRTVITDYEGKLNNIPEKELRLAQLLREKEVNENIYTMLLQKREEAKIAEAEKVGNIRIIDPAKVPRHPYQPRKKLNLAVGFFFGTILGLAFAFAIELLDNKIKTVEEAEQLTKLKTLGAIPKIKGKNRNGGLEESTISDKKTLEMTLKLTTLHVPPLIEAEAFRALLTNIHLSRLDSPPKTILLTSAVPNEGKSLITANMSVISAQSGMKTLLIDADIVKPCLHKLFAKDLAADVLDILVPSKNNLEDLANDYVSVEKIENRIFDIKNGDQRTINSLNPLLRNLNLQQQVSSEEISSLIDHTISATNIQNMDILTCGTIANSSSEFLTTKVLKEIIVKVRHQYDIIFIDSPPINMVPVARVLGSVVDGTILVIRTGHSSTKEVKRAMELLNEEYNNIMGLIVNQINAQDSYSKYYSYYSS